MLWLFVHSARRSLRRLALAAIGVAFPVATLAATLMYIDQAVRAMTPAAVAPVQVEMRALATSLDVDMAAASRRLAAVRGVARVDRFASADVTVSAPGAGRMSARLFAVDPEYAQHHPWVRVVTGTLGGGALLDQTLRAAPGFADARSISIELPGETGPDAAPAFLPLSITGTVDLRQALTWYAIPLGDVQGDLAFVPRSLLIDYATFERSVLPVLRSADGDGSQVFDPGNTDLPPVSVEAHIQIDHGSYPSDPAQAARWSTTLRRVLERQTPGAVVVADNAFEVLTAAGEDATTAKILFLLLGIPGALVAAGIGLAAASALAEARRREDALLQLRGATSRQLVGLTAAHAIVAGVLGSAVGLLAAVAAVGAVTGRSVWREIPPGRLVVSAAVAVAAGAAMIAVRLVPLVRASRHPEVAAQRRLLEAGWVPRWRQARLDVVAILVGLAILAINAVSGGLRQTPIEGQVLALAFYVLLAPIALWFGVTLLVIRAALGGLSRGIRPDRSRPLGTWLGAALRWLGRRPARTGVALVLGALAVAFGTNVVTFAATYEDAKREDVRAAFGADLHLTPYPDPQAGLPPLGPDIAATSAVRMVPARVGTDRKNIQAIDPTTHGQATIASPRMLSGGGIEALRANPKGVLVHQEIANDFEVAPGEALTLTIFPDDKGRTQNLTLEVLGVYRSFPPTDPFAELVMATAVLPTPLPPTDFYLARLAPGALPGVVADDVRRRVTGFTVSTIGDFFIQEQRSLTALDLRGLGRLEAVVAALVAAVGVAVLGAFLVLERRRESAILRTVGASTGQVVTPPVVEGAIAVFGSLIIGMPIGIGLAMLTIRVLGLFFTLPPPLVALPTAALAGLAGLMVLSSALALGLAVAAVARQRPGVVLREP